MYIILVLFWEKMAVAQTGLVRTYWNENADRPKKVLTPFYLFRRRCFFGVF